MTDGERALDPREARSPAEFIAQLSALKEWSGLTYRELTARAEAVGDVLPRSTVANMLARTTVPREELLTAFVRACGAGPAAVESWLAVRKELAVRGRVESLEAEGEGDEVDRPADAWPEDDPRDTAPRPAAAAAPPPAGRSRMPRLLVAVVAFTALVVAVISVVALVRDGGGAGGPGGPKPLSAPAPGPVKIRALHSGLCLNERPKKDDGQVYQVECADATVPLYELERIGGDRWRIVSLHPDYGPGCSGIPAEARLVGGPLQDGVCGKRGAAEAFRFEAFGSPAVGYRMRPTHTELCVGVVGAAQARWARLEQAECAADGAGQLFSFDPRT
ncbi:RICIN domain-containing protein [Streptomyces purpureus]|uniref:RICIN domain-containing protein n=1 Tax=Streptomyces purpureus TaxID=1951 RepID=UPI0037A0893B